MLACLDIDEIESDGKSKAVAAEFLATTGISKVTEVCAPKLRNHIYAASLTGCEAWY